MPTLHVTIEHRRDSDPETMRFDLETAEPKAPEILYVQGRPAVFMGWYASGADQAGYLWARSVVDVDGERATRKADLLAEAEAFRARIDEERCTGTDDACGLIERLEDFIKEAP